MPYFAVGAVVEFAPSLFSAIANQTRKTRHGQFVFWHRTFQTARRPPGLVEGDQPPLFTSKLAAEVNLQPGHDHWTKLIIEQAGSAVIQVENGVLDYVNIAINKDRDRLDISDADDSTWKAHFVIQQQGTNFLNLKGTVNGVPVDIKLHVEKKAFRLTSSEYHIIYKLLAPWHAGRALCFDDQSHLTVSPTGFEPVLP
jgi:hypothetical protein